MLPNKYYGSSTIAMKLYDKNDYKSIVWRNFRSTNVRLAEEEKNK